MCVRCVSECRNNLCVGVQLCLFRACAPLAGGVDALVVDEAAQATEAEVVVALQMRPSKCLLVGDPCAYGLTMLCVCVSFAAATTPSKLHYFDGLCCFATRCVCVHVCVYACVCVCMCVRVCELLWISVVCRPAFFRRALTKGCCGWTGHVHSLGACVFVSDRCSVHVRT